MNQGSDCRAIAPLLPALPDGDLPPPAAARVQAHLAVCPACREEAQALLGLGALLRQTPVPEATLPTGAQAAAWIERAASRIDPDQGFSLRACTESPAARLPGVETPVCTQRKPPSRLGQPNPRRVPAQRGVVSFRTDQGFNPRRRALALVALGVVACLAVWRAVRPPDATWEVVRLAGTPQVGRERIGATGRLKVGQWLVTDGASQAQLELANVGQVMVEPNTRLRLIEARPDEHRLALACGVLHARVSAPPRLFFVDTPSAEAVDLGCAYSLTVDGAGRGLLQVTWGRVAFVKNGRETVVPAGARCETRPGIGPGTPYFDDAPPALRQALDQLDFQNGGGLALQVVLAQARRRDSLTLWHLLLKLPPAEANQVYERLAALDPPPPGVTREGVLRRDPKMLDLWQAEVEMAWWE